MQKNIHIRSSVDIIDACWIRSSKYKNNVFKEFNHNKQGLHELITWLQHGYEDNKIKINVIIESYENCHSHLIEVLTNIGVSVSISRMIDKNQLNQHIVNLHKKIKFLSKMISEYEINLSLNHDNGQFNLSNINFEGSIGLLKEQLLSTKDQCETYTKWQST